MTILKKNIPVKENFFELLGFGLLREGSVSKRFEGYVSLYWLDDKLFFYEVVSDIADRLEFTSKMDVPILQQYVVLEYNKKKYKRLHSYNIKNFYLKKYKKKLPGLRKFLLLKQGTYSSSNFFGGNTFYFFQSRIISQNATILSYGKELKSNLIDIEYNLSLNGFIFVFVRKNLLLRGKKGSNFISLFRKNLYLGETDSLLRNGKLFLVFNILKYFKCNRQVSNQLLLKMKILLFYLSFLSRFLLFVAFPAIFKPTFLLLKHKFTFSEEHKGLKWVPLTTKKFDKKKIPFNRRRKRRYFVKIFKRLRNPHNIFIQKGYNILNNGLFFYYISYLFNFLFRSLICELRLFKVLSSVKKTKKEVLGERCVNSSVQIKSFIPYIELYNMFTKVTFDLYNFIIRLYWFSFVITLLFENKIFVNSLLQPYTQSSLTKLGVQVPYVKNKYKGLWELHSLARGKQIIGLK